MQISVLVWDLSKFLDKSQDIFLLIEAIRILDKDPGIYFYLYMYYSFLTEGRCLFQCSALSQFLNKSWDIFLY